MITFHLCSVCKEIVGSDKVTFKENSENKKCHVCENKCEKLPEMIKMAGELIKNQNAKTFSISTLLPKDFLTLEEDVWDNVFENNAQSIKSLLNRKISYELAKHIGAKYSKEGAIKLDFDFGKMEVRLDFNDVFIFGRYKKFDNTLSQSRWTCGFCEGAGCEKCSGSGKKFTSIEEKIGIPLKEMLKAQDYTLHASGREDVDAFNTAGRPFVMMLKKAQLIPDRKDLEKAYEHIKVDGKVEVNSLKVVTRSFVEMVTESHFDKEYMAEVEFDREISRDEMKKIESLNGKTLNQQTPLRVMHRRADLTRNRKIKKIKIISSEKNKATIEVLAEAGTYIKELISGDEGRTEPSISQILKCKSHCTKLTVTKIDDGFLDFVLEKI